MADKIYLRCKAKERTTKFGKLINVGVKVSDLLAFAKEHENDRGYLNLTISERKEPGQYGDTHSVFLDDYTPTTTRREQSGWD